MATITQPLTSPLGPRDAGMPMTLDEFEAAYYEEGYRYELIHGVLVVTPPPLEEERDANEELGYWLRRHQDSHPEGKCLDLTLPEHNLRTLKQNRRPDRVIWTGLGRMPKTRGAAEERDLPSIIVEFPSSRPSDQRRDYEEKRIEYRKLGVKQYWIIDRFRRAMVVYAWRKSKWSKREVSETDIYQTPLLPGFELPVGKLIALTDRYRFRQ